MIEGLFMALAAYRLRRALAVVRENMAILGFSIDDLTDEQIMEHIQRIGVAMRASGLSAERAATVFTNAGEIARSNG